MTAGLEIVAVLQIVYRILYAFSSCGIEQANNLFSDFVIFHLALSFMLSYKLYMDESISFHSKYKNCMYYFLKGGMALDY